MSRSYQVLTDEQIESFVTRGYVVLHDCFSRDAAKALTDKAWVRLGYDPEDPSTWEQAVIHMPTHERFDVREFAPKVWAAACDLLGGEDRVKQPYTWGDGFIVNLHEGADRPWAPPSPSVGGWHKDGDFFRHFLDSPEQGLLTLVLWSDIEHRGRATFVAADSVPVVARYLVEHPEGVLPTEFPVRSLIAECSDFVEATGRVGDVYLLHPYILHAKSQNLLGVPRLITNPPVHLKEPLSFNRPDPAEYSPVELAVLRGLGVESLDFQPTAPRERVIRSASPGSRGCSRKRRRVWLPSARRGDAGNRRG
ncbi:MAG: hypothetical protein M3Q29_25185 [Chloroflexota bacterium]|nr:hypothetical protein [Chloroflexota bacterium]